MPDTKIVDAVTTLTAHRGNALNTATTTLDKEFAGTLATQIVEVLSSQNEVSSSQTTELIEAVREQTAVLQKLTDLLLLPKTNGAASSMASTAAETAELSTNDTSIVSTKVTAPTPKVAMRRASPKKEAKPEPSVLITRGPWGFVETKEAIERRSGNSAPKSPHKLRKDNALFGTSSGSDLIGDSFGESWDRMRNHVNQYGKLQSPKWSVQAKHSVRDYLPKLTIGGKTEIEYNSGIYYVTIKYSSNDSGYNGSGSSPVEAAIIIGEISFDNSGSVIAPGVKWAKVFSGKKQKKTYQLPYKSKWYASKVSDPWKNGDVIRFKVDTNTNTLVYTLTAYGAKEVKAGWKFDNILTFSNVPAYPNDIRMFAYCGGRGKLPLSKTKLTIVDETPIDSKDRITSTMIEDEDEEQEEVTKTKAGRELETVAETIEPEKELEQGNFEINSIKDLICDTSETRLTTETGHACAITTEKQTQRQQGRNAVML